MFQTCVGIFSKKCFIIYYGDKFVSALLSFFSEHGQYDPRKLVDAGDLFPDNESICREYVECQRSDEEWFLLISSQRNETHWSR